MMSDTWALKRGLIIEAIGERINQQGPPRDASDHTIGKLSSHHLFSNQSEILSHYGVTIVSSSTSDKSKALEVIKNTYL